MGLLGVDGWMIEWGNPVAFFNPEMSLNGGSIRFGSGTGNKG